MEKRLGAVERAVVLIEDYISKRSEPKGLATRIKVAVRKAEAVSRREALEEADETVCETCRYLLSKIKR